MGKHIVYSPSYLKIQSWPLNVWISSPPQVPYQNLLHLFLNSHGLNSLCEVLKYQDIKQLNFSFSFSFLFNTKWALPSLIHSKTPAYLYKNFHLLNTFSHTTLHRIYCTVHNYHTFISSHALAQAHLNLTSVYLSLLSLLHWQNDKQILFLTQALSSKSKSIHHSLFKF